jgi:beta-mannosidase
LTLVIEPENFSGQPFSFEETVPLNGTVRWRFSLPDFRLWWPNGAGEQALYRGVAVLESGGETIWRSTTFGLRTIEMMPLPEGPAPDTYNWTFVINGRPMFVKGTGWCTMDSSLDFSRARYERFLTLAADQHCQMVRSWGSGMPETDDFYDLCDRLGLMVLQEWPTAWNSQKLQPYLQLEETVRQNTLRLRNRPSLVMWGGGNESMDVEDPIIDMMGRHAIELDGTRPFHRGEPRGGSQHNYDCWWGLKPLDHNVTMEAPFWGEFGIASTPVEESVLRYLPEDEREIWPPAEEGSFAHHTPVFNGLEDMKRLRFYAESFASGSTLAEFVRASQVAQVTALRHTLERSRVRWPHCTGALYYKLNDNYPAISWSTVDWYGAAKVAHYFCQDVFAPVHACVLVPKLNVFGEDVALPVYLLDDHGALAGQSWSVSVRVFDGRLGIICDRTFSGIDSRSVQEVGRLHLSVSETEVVPLLIVVEWTALEKNGRTFCWLNYDKKQGALFELPKTELDIKIENGSAVLTNTGSFPAVGAHVLRPGHLDTFRASDNYFWLDAGESISVAVSETDNLQAAAWNV